MTIKTKKILAAICITLTALTAVSLTAYAYLQSEKDQPNQFIVGEGIAEITESFTEPSYMSMSDVTEKKVMVKNTGTSDQFVRVFLDFSDSRIREGSGIRYTKNNTPQQMKCSPFVRQCGIIEIYRIKV